jgi:hypothetical protein
MKHLVLTTLLVLICFSGFAQSGVIYNFLFRIDKELTTQMKVQNKDHKILNISTIEEMPKELSDTLILISEQMIGELLTATMTSMRPDEDKLFSPALPEHLMYLPANTFRRSTKIYDSLNIFVEIQCHIAAMGGVKVSFGDKSFSKLKPTLKLRIKILDKEKNEIDSKKVVLKDFEKLRSKSFEKTYGIKGLAVNTDQVTKSETINSNDVLRMYVMGLVEAINN